MPAQIAFELLLIFLLVIANGVFAMAEIAIVSARKARLEARSEQGDRRARVALELAQSPNDFLSTVQIGITLVGILAGVFGGATLSEHLAARLNRISWVAPHGEQVAVGVVVVGITYLSLILGELVPKRIALTNPERIAAFMAPMMRGLARRARPAVWFLSVSTHAIVKLLRIRQSDEPAVTEAEVTSMLELGTKTGEFHPAERDMIEGVFALGDRTARTIMTPRHDVVWLDLTRPDDALRQLVIDTRLTRYPVAERNLDAFIGVVDVRDLAARCLSGQPVDFRAATREALVFHENASALQILHEFQEKRADIGIVVDEYGGFEGLVTIADLATRVLGLDYDEPQITEREDGSWLVDAMMDFHDFAEEIGFRHAPEGDYETVAGFVISRLGRLPRVADHLEEGGFRFEVVDMDGRRVDKVLVSTSATNTTS